MIENFLMIFQGRRWKISVVSIHPRNGILKQQNCTSAVSPIYWLILFVSVFQPKQIIYSRPAIENPIVD